VDELNKKLQEGVQATAVTDTTRSDTLYQKGLESFKAGDMPTARTQLTAFIDQQPQHELVANARYWIGESFYSEKNYEQAILEFQEVIKQFPKKEKAPSAMLKQALAFKALQDIKSSRYVLGKLVQEYPKSEEAKRARVLLKELK
jgi:tol-pal system protein YbgF